MLLISLATNLRGLVTFLQLVQMCASVLSSVLLVYCHWEMMLDSLQGWCGNVSGECWLLTIRSVNLGIRKLILPVRRGCICFCLGTAFLYLLLQLQPYQDLIVLWEWSIFKHWLFCFLGCSCHFLASPKVLFLSTFSSFTPAGVSTHLFVKAEDLFSLSKAKEHLFSRCMYVSWMISNKVISNIIKTLQIFFNVFQRGKKRWNISNAKNGDPVGHIFNEGNLSSSTGVMASPSGGIALWLWQH